MNTNTHECKPEDEDKVAEAVIGAAYEVSNTLGAGFLEKVYERALTRELVLRGLDLKCQVHYAITYKGQCVGEYVADMVVQNQLLVELKCVECFSNEHVAQCINYLKASELRLALLIKNPGSSGNGSSTDDSWPECRDTILRCSFSRPPWPFLSTD